MPVTDQTPVDSSTGNGVTTVFPYTFKILDEADILVTVDGVTKILTTDYSVSGVGNDAGGNVTFVAAPANGTTVVRTRDMGYERTTDYQDNGDLPASTLDDDIDRTVMLIQQLRAALLRSVKLPVGTTVEQVLTESAAARADKIMGFDSSGNIVVKAAVDIDVTPVSVFMASVLDDTTWQEALNTLGFKKGADITAAATTDLGTATGNSVDVTHSTGTTAITSLGGASLQAGAEIETRFVISGGTLTLTHHATNLYLAGRANITLANGDVIHWRKMHSSNAEWKMVGGVKANGAAWAGNPIYGQCILDKVSTNLVLSPCNGNLLTINGVAYEIPDAGVSLSAAAVSDGVKYIYAYMNSGTMTLEASTTARATSTTAGNKGTQIKSGDDSRTLVGAAYCQSNAWYDRNDARHVLSWFNRRDITGRAWLTTNRTVAAVGPQEIHTEARVYFICWADEAVHAHANGTASNSNAFQTTDMCIGIDGVSVIGGISKQANTTAASVNSLAATTQAPAGQLTEAALHYLVLAGGATANTATYYGGADNALRCEINFRTRG